MKVLFLTDDKRETRILSFVQRDQSIVEHQASKYWIDNVPLASALQHGIRTLKVKHQIFIC